MQNKKRFALKNSLFASLCFAASAAAYAQAPNATITVPSIEFVSIPGGCYQMGSNTGEKHERPVHEECVKSFELGKYEVTQEQWRAVMGNNPSYFAQCGANCPVEQVSWNDAQEFIKKLNTATGKNVYRLPSEAEWEYACRSGGKDQEYAGDVAESKVGDIAWYKTDNTDSQKTFPAGQKKPNGLGLFDMSGNVWEWTQDKFASPYVHPEKQNNSVFDAGDARTIRGGSWNGKVRYVRCAIRNRYPVTTKDYRIGFRLVRDQSQK